MTCGIMPILVTSILAVILAIAFLILFYNQRKILNNEKTTHTYLLQFEDVRTVAIEELYKHLQKLYLKEGENKHFGHSNKILLKEIEEVETRISHLQNLQHH